MIMHSFFEKQGPLSIEDRVSSKREIRVGGTFEEAFTSQLPKTGTFKVIVHNVHSLQFGYYKDGQFMMNDQAPLDEKWIEQIRVFNKDEEHFCKKMCDQCWRVRHIVDGEGEPVRTVDASSSFIGEKVAQEVPQGFVALHEKGRKFTYVIPADEPAKHYSLLTRSYITYDAQTGQASYGYSRYVDIEAGQGRKGDA